jgi:hypothetical protein
MVMMTSRCIIPLRSGRATGALVLRDAAVGAPPMRVGHGARCRGLFATLHDGHTTPVCKHYF